MVDSIIVGAGLIGMFTARELALSGQKVMVLDRQQSGQESSWAGGGILSPLYPWRYPEAVTRLAAWSQKQYPGIIGQIRSQTGLDPELQRCGFMMLDTGDASEAFAWASRHSVHMTILALEALLEEEPNLAQHFTSGIILPDVGQIRNPRLVKALRAQLEHLGVEIREYAEVRDIEVEHQQVQAVVTTEDRLTAGSVVVASGAWSSQLLASHFGKLPVEPVRGQMLLFKAEPGLVRHILLGEGHYLVPRLDGRVLVGSTLEYVGFDKSTTTEAYEHLHAQALRLVPALEDYPVEKHWSGLRPGSVNDGIPFIGQMPGVKGLYINTGHFRNGVVLAPASARLLVDLMLNREPIVDPESYTPAPVKSITL